MPNLKKHIVYGTAIALILWGVGLFIWFALPLMLVGYEYWSAPKFLRAGLLVSGVVALASWPAAYRIYFLCTENK